MESQSETFDPRTAFDVVRRRAVLILISCIGVGVAAFASSVAKEKQYTASASLLFRDPGFGERFGASFSQAFQDPVREAATNVGLASLPKVADRTAADLPGEITGAEVAASVAVEGEGQSDVAAVTATHPNPELAATIANQYAENYIEFRREADQAKVAEATDLVEAEYAQLDKAEAAGEEGGALQQQISELKTLEALQTGNAELVQEASPPATPSSPKVTRDTLVGIALGLMLGLGAAFLRERLDRRLKAPDELERAFGLPVLGTVPESKTLGREGSEQSDEGITLPFSEAEAFRMVRTRLRYFNVDREVRSVLVTSSAPADGKSTVAWNLAFTAAGAGSPAILIEADFHQPTIGAKRGLAPLPGLAELLTHQSQLEAVVQQVPAGGQAAVNGGGASRSLDVIVAGASPPNPAELLESEEMAKLIETAASEYELVVVDTPPMAVLADAIPLMKLVSGVIVVARINRTTRDEAAHFSEQLSKLKAPTLGVVANRARGSRSRGYDYGYYSGRGPRLTAATRNSPPVAR